MTETQDLAGREASARTREVALRIERMRMPEDLSRASRRVEELRGNGAKQGDPELEEATQRLRELSSRERELPHLIASSVAKRLRAEALRLSRDASFLGEEHAKLLTDYKEALNEAKIAQRSAEEIRVRMEAIETRRDALVAQARPREDFATKASELEGNRRLRLLDDAHRAGLLLDLPPVAYEAENGS